MTTYEGNIVITRHSGGRTDDDSRCITIAVQDKNSGIQFIEIELTPLEFARAIFGHYTTCQFNLRGLDLVGCAYENKTENVPYTRGVHAKPNRAAMQKALEPFEVDGWRGDMDDLENHHRHVSAGVQRVTFRRYLRDGVPVILTREESAP